MTAPTWSPSGEDDLLALVAQGSATGTADDEWAFYLEALRTEAIAGAGDIDPNRLRGRVRGAVYHKRLGAFAHRAVSRGLVTYDGWTESTDREGRNAGRPIRKMRATSALFAGGAA